ncbi:MAG: hypothetical protein PHS88_09615, partial [Candidatus Omnitrophica bacterium]|nr:hypothetical protein [Candidatus Omnitrophota bacterium]
IDVGRVFIGQQKGFKFSLRHLITPGTSNSLKSIAYWTASGKNITRWPEFSKAKQGFMREGAKQVSKIFKPPTRKQPLLSGVIPWIQRINVFEMKKALLKCAQRAYEYGESRNTGFEGT